MRFRKMIFWLHLTAGVFAGIVIFIMSVTGVALMYQKQMTEWADRAYWPQAPASDGEPLSMETMVFRLKETYPEAEPSAVVFYSDTAAPAKVTIGAGHTVFVDRYTGDIGGEGPASIRAFFRVMTEWHRWLGDDSRSWGKAITGACNLAFLFIVFSGPYLWWPRHWSWQSVRAVTWFKGGLTARARDFNWHNIFGFWTAIPLFFIVISATVISYTWASDLVYRITGTDVPVRGPRAAAGDTRSGEGKPIPDLAAVDSLLARAAEHVPNWRTISVNLPSMADDHVTFAIDEGWGGQPQLRSTLVLEKTSGNVARFDTFANQNTGQRTRSWLRFVHTGEYYGLIGQTTAGIASAGGAMLVFTGLSLTIRRLAAWLVRRRRTELERLRQSPVEEVSGD